MAGESVLPDAKTDLAARPIFHHTREVIEAPLTIDFAALAIVRDLRDLTGVSIKKTIKTLRPLKQITVKTAGHEHIAADPIPADAAAILSELQVAPH